MLRMVVEREAARCATCIRAQQCAAEARVEEPGPRCLRGVAVGLLIEAVVALGFYLAWLAWHAMR